MSLFVHGGQYSFETVKMALDDIGSINSVKKSDAILIWHDALKDKPDFESLRSWQVINRIPSIAVLTKKYSLAKLYNIGKHTFKDEFNYMPRTYILPDQSEDFKKELEISNTSWIIKPDNGSLGLGIEIVEPQMSYDIPEGKYVAQEFIKSYALDNKKFDFRIYVLISSVDPLIIYVYKDGVVRFCSSEIGKDNIYSRITNVKLNQSKTDDMKQIVRLISEIFPRLRDEGVNTDKLWQEIKRIIVDTVLLSTNYILPSVNRVCKTYLYSRCFQILGFDILLDQDCKPWVLEVNYRPSLNFHRGCERRLKKNMISDSIKISVPLAYVQGLYLYKKTSWTDQTWCTFVSTSGEVAEIIKRDRKLAEYNSQWEKVFDSTIQTLSTANEIYNYIREQQATPLPGASYIKKGVE